MPKIKTPEAAVLRACREYLDIQGHIVARINNGAFETKRGGFVRCTDVAGFPDIIGCAKGGRALAVECKSDKGKLSPHQKEFRDGWEKTGGLYVLARGIEDLQAAGL